MYLRLSEILVPLKAAPRPPATFAPYGPQTPKFLAKHPHIHPGYWLTQANTNVYWATSHSCVCFDVICSLTTVKMGFYVSPNSIT